ncbi:AAA-ATPase Vps4-associated 1 family protein [Aspergillus undulatus]|uniref:AAA-ATPase Vps4-associated 1 family protein n=1 Tax=Aspergillus undulatus TaxID=1810928 RepID=UPI003CCDC91F
MNTSTMATTLPNTWHLRRVADTAAKACLICHKPSSSVLITPNNKDFFYVCPVHLKDRHFCSPIIDAEEEAAKRKAEAMEKEIEKVKKEYEEKQRRKKEKKKDESKDREKDKDDESKDDSKKTDADKKDEKERDENIDAIKKQSTSTSASIDDGPRIFSLHKNFYQMRIDRMRNIEAAKRNRQRLQDPSFFPSAPSGGL